MDEDQEVHVPKPLVERLERFIDLTDEERALLDEVTGSARVIKSRRYSFIEGAHSSDVYILIDGYACEYRILRDGGRQIVRFLIPGDVFNQNASILRAHRSNFVAQTSCQLMGLPQQAVDRILQVPRLAKAWMQADRLDYEMLIETVVRLGRRAAFARTAHFICETYARMHQRQIAKDGHLPFPLTQQDVADLLGISTVHTNRSIRNLVEQDLIDYRSKRIRILDETGLRRLAEYNEDYLYVHSELAEKRALVLD